MTYLKNISAREEENVKELDSKLGEAAFSIFGSIMKVRENYWKQVSLYTNWNKQLTDI